MSKATDRIQEWAGQGSAYEGNEWEKLPEIYLYMDQVLTYMNRLLSPFERSGGAGPLTSSMINNYVKDGILPRPEQKKYSRDHLALLTVICMLKPVLSIPDIGALLKQLLENATGEQMYNRFNAAQSEAFRDVCRRVEETAPLGDAELTRLAVALSIEANARRAAAERILSELSHANNADNEKK